MPLHMPTNGEADGLAAYVAKAAAQDLDLRLYQNDYTPVDASTAANFTEATFTGYAAIQLTAANWTITEANPSHADYPEQLFTSTADQAVQNIYGYYLTRRTSGRIAYAERFSDGPYAVSKNGDKIKPTPKIEWNTAP